MQAREEGMGRVAAIVAVVIFGLVAGFSAIYLLLDSDWVASPVSRIRSGQAVEIILDTCPYSDGS